MSKQTEDNWSQVSKSVKEGLWSSKKFEGESGGRRVRFLSSLDLKLSTNFKVLGAQRVYEYPLEKLPEKS